MNVEIRKLNLIRFQKKSMEDLNRRLAWGTNQERLKNYAIKVISKIYKNSF